ncbi:hypothetical protein BDQ12DRAFT_689802 [Crucibulum laeve]|uniref:CFEM domain-containing protein n=1 Tax=Crucibulum laeve TaxID=68775 RepID=A0A5C3LNN2_9AGAR|nr:hypothetical protein BDQ12DRAFT_689802 [Crucibulum laeve]
MFSSIQILIALQLITGVFLIQVGAQGVASLPECAKTCVEGVATTVGCQTTDARCMCASSSFMSGTTQCVRNNCRIEDQVSAGGILEEMCRSVATPSPPIATASSAVSLPFSTGGPGPISTGSSNPSSPSAPSPSSPAPPNSSNPPSPNSSSSTASVSVITSVSVSVVTTTAGAASASSVSPTKTVVVLSTSLPPVASQTVNAAAGSLRGSLGVGNGAAGVFGAVGAILGGVLVL